MLLNAESLQSFSAAHYSDRADSTSVWKTWLQHRLNRPRFHPTLIIQHFDLA